MDSESNSGESRESTGHESAEKSSKELSAEGSSFAKEYEKLREAAFERLREFLCGDRSQTGTGKGANGSLDDRATGRDADNPLGTGKTLLSGPEQQSDQRKQNDPSKNPAFEFGIADLTSPDVTRLNYSRIRLEYHCDTGDVAINDIDGLIAAYQQSQEKHKTVKEFWDYAKFLLEPKEMKERITEGLSIIKDKLFEPTETSEKADLDSETIKESQIQDANSFSRGLADWSTFRSERIALGNGGNARCNMPDFKSPGIDQTFK